MPIPDITDEGWLGTLERTLNSTFRGARKALTYVIPRRSGRIINVSSSDSKGDCQRCAIGGRQTCDAWMAATEQIGRLDYMEGGEAYISDPGVVRISPVSSQVLSPDRIMGQPP
jgi:hypothetical protein